MFQNIVAIVSGGASGLGAATASYLVRNGARVIVADLPSASEQFGRMQADVNADSSLVERLKFAEVDVTCEEDVVDALDVAVNEFGEQGMCTLVCSFVLLSCVPSLDRYIRIDPNFVYSISLSNHLVPSNQQQ
jgi:NAD(P)-dependent dehydrogenase (short-subunit alcohol dehydrogenase family)